MTLADKIRQNHSTIPEDMVETLRQQRFNMKAPKIKMHEAYLSELFPLGCVPIYVRPAIRNYLTRSLFDGVIIHNDNIIKARLLRYESGNCKVLYLQGEGAEEVASLVDEIRISHPIHAAIRKFSRYLYFIATPPVSFVTVLGFIQGNVTGGIVGIMILMALRIFYTQTRNRCLLTKREADNYGKK